MPESAPNSGHAVLDGLYELHDTVGTGGFAKVKVATHLLTGLKVCIIKTGEKETAENSWKSEKYGNLSL